MDLDASNQPVSDTDIPLPAGRVLAGRYELRRRIGTSGTGAIYAAYDRERQTEVAIQVALAHQAVSEQDRTRFLYEAEVASRLDHAGILRVYERRADGDLHFTVTELPVGQTLRARMVALTAEGSRPPVDDVVRIGSALSHTLGYLREAQAVHSGITPQHIILGDDRTVKLTGFGSGRLPSARHITADGDSYGTLAYAAPEQLMGKADVDHRADQYALAAVLYEMLTGEAPVGRVQSARQRRPEVPPALSAALDRALAFDPNDRFPDIGAFNAALTARSSPRARKGRLWAVAAIMLLVVGVIATYPKWRDSIAQMARDAARNPEAEAAARAARTDALALAARWSAIVDALPSDLRPDGATPADDSMSSGNWHLAAMEDIKALQSFRHAATLFESQIEETTQSYRAEPARVAAAARGLLATLDSLERQLRDRVAEAARQLDFCQRDLRNARGRDEVDFIEARQQEAERELSLLNRLKSLNTKYAFSPSLRAELTGEMNRGDRHLEAARYADALASYGEVKARVEASLHWPDKAEAALRKQQSARRRIELIRSALGPKALELPGVQAVLDAASARIEEGGVALTEDRIPEAEALFESASASLADTIDEAAAALVSQARLDAEQRNGTAAILVLDELAGLDPNHTGAGQLRAEVMSYRVTNSIGMELAFIPPGEFLMGSPSDEVGRDNDERQRRVRLASGFYMATTEVTQAQWSAVMDGVPDEGVGVDLPVQLISWDDVAEFCRRLSEIEGKPYRLPTEAEWEYACRAGGTTPFSFGETITAQQANFDSNYVYGRAVKEAPRGEPVPVASFSPNAWGLYDMHGNVWEWCPDGYAYDTQSPVVPPPGKVLIEGRVLRGGSWRNRPRFCRSANRVRDTEDSKLGNIGFRVVLEMP